MSVLHSYEETIDGWYKKSPVHLPDAARTWIADNAWWIIIVGATLSVLSIISSLQTLLWADQLLDSLRQYSAAVGVDTSASSMAEVGLWVSVVTFAVAVVIELRAVSPLRLKRKLGWDLLILASVVSIVGGLAAGILSGAIVTTIIYVVLGAAISGFFLFEIREKFLVSTKAKTDTTKSV